MPHLESHCKALERVLSENGTIIFSSLSKYAEKIGAPIVICTTTMSWFFKM